MKRLLPTLLLETIKVLKTSPFSFVTKFQAFLSLLSFLANLLIFSSLYSQPTVPQLQLEEYSSNLMNNVYGQSYFLNTLSAWSEQVGYYKGLIRAYWEQEADVAIYDYVSQVTTSDSFNDVDAYKDYLQRELESQKIAALNDWEQAANLDLLKNKEEFLEKITNGKFNETYIVRTGQEALYKQYLYNTSNTAILQSQVSQAAANWNYQFNLNLQSGSADFANSMAAIQENYNGFLSALDASEATFQANLDAINVYKTSVKTGIGAMMDGFDTDLSAACTTAGGCTYKNTDGSLNSAGQTLSALVTSVRNELARTDLDVTNVLTTISSQITSFLNTQTTSATTQYTTYNNRIYSYQNSTNFNYNNLTVNSNPNALINEVINGSYMNLVNNGYGNQTLSNWLSWGLPISQIETDLFQTIGDANLRNMFQAIRSGDNGAIAAQAGIMMGLGSDKRVVNVLTANLYTDFLGYANKWDSFAWSGEAHHTGNMILDDGAGVPFYTYSLFRGPIEDRYLMGGIGYGFVVTVEDLHARSLSEYWGDNRNSLSGQLGMYVNNINPAIGNWENQVTNYNQFYTDWKTQANILKAQAKADYEKSLEDLEIKKSQWLAKMEEERQVGLTKWVDLYDQAGAVKNSQDLNAFNGVAGTSLASISVGTGSTGTNEILNNYGNSLNQLAQTQFTFTETVTQTTNMFPTVDASNLAVMKLTNELPAIGKTAGGINDKIEIYEGVSIFKQVMEGNFTAAKDALLGAVGVSTVSAPAPASQTFNVFGAAYQKTIDTELSVNGKGIDQVFQTTTNGVYQYAQILSINENNANVVAKEQEKLLNQMTYAIKWEDKAVVKYGDDGKIVAPTEELKKIFEDLNNQRVARLCEGKTGKDAETCFYDSHKMQMDRLKDLGLEYTNGMIVTSLSREEKIKLGQTEKLTLTDAEKKIAGTCYANPASCESLLRQEYTYTVNKETNVATISKIISDGNIAGKNGEGKYFSGTQNEVRHISLSQVGPVVAPKGKDLFDVWTNEDWDEVETAVANTMNNYFETSFSEDAKNTSEAASSIAMKESANEKSFQSKKQAAEEADSLVGDLVLAYISGGTSGVRAAIKSQIENRIHVNLATAYVRGTGGGDDEIQLVADMIGFVRGKISENKAKRQMKNNQIKIAVGTAVAYVMATVTGGASLALTANLTAAAASGTAAVVAGANQMAAATASFLSNPMAVAGAVTFGQATVTTTAGVASAIAKPILGEKNYAATMDNITGPQDRINEAKLEREGVIKQYSSQALANATGLPPELMGSFVADLMGSKKAAAARAAVNANPFANFGSQIVGAVGGIIKTAVVATGVPERNIQEAFSDGNRMAFANSGSYIQMQSSAYANQSYGMKAQGLSYTSSTPTLKNQEAFVEELGQRIVIDELVKTTGLNRSIVDASFRKTYGNIKQKREDRKAQNEAVRSTAVTAATTALTLGAAGALGATMRGFLTGIGTALGATANAANVGAAILSGTIQAIDGSRNGTEGMLAGIINGTIGALTAGGKLDLSGRAAELLGKGALGLGVSYDKQA
ncbi:TIGR04388 family protein, partial [Leptospira idonii]